MRKYHCKPKRCRYCKNSFEPRSGQNKYCCASCQFWDKVKLGPPSECWPWVYAKNTNGYGHFMFQANVFWTHRFMWEEIHGKIPEDLHVLHKCDSPSCINPVHLFLGTPLENMKDMFSKARNPNQKGEKNNSAKLTDNDVRNIKQLLSKSIIQKNIAHLYNVSISTISLIKRKTIWSHIQ